MSNIIEPVSSLVLALPEMRTNLNKNELLMLKKSKFLFSIRTIQNSHNVFELKCQYKVTHFIRQSGR